MIKLLLFVIIITLLASGLWYVDARFGTLTIHWSDYVIDITTAGMLISFLAMGFGFFLFYYGLWWLFTAKQRLQRMRYHHQQKRQLTALIQGIIGFSKNNSMVLHKSANILAKHDQDHPAALLFRAHAAEVEHKSNTAAQAYKAMLDNLELLPVGLKGLLKQAHDAHDYDTALNYARRLFKASPHDEGTAKILLHLLIRGQYWLEAQSTVKIISDKKLMPKATMMSLRQKILVERSRATPNDDEALSLAKQAFTINKTFTPALFHYGNLLAQKEAKAAERLVTRQWSTTPTIDVAKLFLTLTQDQANDSPQKWQKSIQKITSTTPERAGSLYLLATAATRTQDMQLAYQLWQQLASLRPSKEVYQQLASLEQRLGHTDAADNYRQKAHNAKPFLLWQCQQCHHDHYEWQLVCSNCHSIDTVHDSNSGILLPMAH